MTTPYNPQDPNYAPPPPPPFTQPEAKKKLSTGKKVAIGAAVVVGVIIAANAGNSTTTTTPKATSDDTVVTQGTTAAAPATTKAPAGPKTTFGNGTYLVGTQIVPGTYQATAKDGCYWEREKDGSGSFSSIIANDFVAEAGQQTVTIDASDFAFKTKGCGTWTLVSQ